MGKEIRIVPAKWEHPKKDNGDYYPLHEGFDGALQEFEEHIKDHGIKEALEYFGGGPVPEDYVDYKGQEEEWFQMYETVSEGAPLTPPFETKEELVDYLVTNGDFWDGRWSRAGAEKFVKDEWCPSMIVTAGKVCGPQEMHKL